MATVNNIQIVTNGTEETSYAIGADGSNVSCLNQNGTVSDVKTQVSSLWTEVGKCRKKADKVTASDVSYTEGTSSSSNVQFQIEYLKSQNTEKTTAISNINSQITNVNNRVTDTNSEITKIKNGTTTVKKAESAASLTGQITDVNITDNSISGSKIKTNNYITLDGKSNSPLNTELKATGDWIHSSGINGSPIKSYDNPSKRMYGIHHCYVGISEDGKNKYFHIVYNENGTQKTLSFQAV